MKRDYYEILGVAKGTSVDEIKKAYRTLAMKFHPDRVPAEQKKEAEEKFKEISEAYAVLSDSQKRAVYDQYGHQGFDQRYSTEDIFRNTDFSSIFEEFGLGGGGGASGSIFEDLLGGLFGMGGGSRGRGGRGGDLQGRISVTFEEAVRGVTKTITVPRRELCTECHGEGGTRKACATCQGAGQVRQSSGFFTVARTCPRCQGQGSVVTKACPNCRGAGRVSIERKIQVKVPAGIEDGMQLRIGGEGEGGLRGRGDLYVEVRVEPHPVFQRDGGNLLLDYPMHIDQAALGADVELPTMNGRVSMKIPAGTQSGTVFRVRGKGVPDLRDGRPGDLLVRVAIETPTNLSGKQRQLLQELGKSFEDDAQHPSRRSFLDRLRDVLLKKS